MKNGHGYIINDYTEDITWFVLGIFYAMGIGFTFRQKMFGNTWHEQYLIVGVHIVDVVPSLTMMLTEAAPDRSGTLFQDIAPVAALMLTPCIYTMSD